MVEEIEVMGTNISVKKNKTQDYISLTDIAKYKNSECPADIIKNWMRSKDTIEFLGLWERINNHNFKLVEFEGFRNEAGVNSFVLSPKKWIENTSSIGIISKSGKNGGTFAHKDIAFEFASWISVEFRLFLIKEFQRLQDNENEKKQLGWDVKRDIAKINYKIQTDAIKQNLIPLKLNKEQTKKIYANEADVLNVVLFGMTAKEWRDKNKDKKGNIRDFANVAQLICLSNLESLNAVMINEKQSQKERLIKLNKVAINQMKLLLKDSSNVSKKLIKNEVSI